MIKYSLEPVPMTTFELICTRGFWDVMLLVWSPLTIYLTMYLIYRYIKKEIEE